VGTSGCGKSTFSNSLASILDCPHVELDRLFWRPNWQNASDEEFFSNLEEVLKGEKWVVDGNYKRSTLIKWKNVQLVIWLDYFFNTILYRAVKRALWRTITQEEMWGTGNKESLGKLLGKDSIVRWTIRTYKTNIEKYEEAMNDARYGHITFVRLKSPNQAEMFLRSLQ